MNKTKNKIKPKFIVCLVSVILVISAIITTVVVVHNQNDTPIFFSTKEEKVFGIDVSSHNGTIEWQKVKKTDVEFTFVRVGIRGYSKGTISEDSEYNNNLQGANKANIPVGVYFYSQATNEKEGEEEAQFVLDAIKGYDIDLPVVIDVEYAYNSDGELAGRLYDAKLSPKEQSKIINAFAKKISSAGYTPMLYSNSSTLSNSIDVSKLHSNILLWVADYNEEVTYSGNFNMWQYSKRGKVDGVKSKYVDLNYWFNIN